MQIDHSKSKNQIHRCSTMKLHEKIEFKEIFNQFVFVSDITEKIININYCPYCGIELKKAMKCNICNGSISECMSCSER